ncbi:hypothetical protein Tco_1106026 [Tanacetum coccineum]
MKGVIRIEGDEITIYKKVTRIKTSNQTEVAKVAITELETDLKTFSNNGRFIQKHVDSLLKLGTIRPSKSRHKIMAMIVNSGITIDPATGREIKGKERMVFNYKSLNDNTYKDQYSLPEINTIIKRVGGAKIFSKFDLKSGFHQVCLWMKNQSLGLRS